MRYRLLIFLQEFIWVFLIIALSAVVIYPIEQKINFHYRGINIFFIAITLQYFRYILIFPRLRFFASKISRYLLFTFNLVLIVFLFNQIEVFLNIKDNFNILDYGTRKLPMDLSEEAELFGFISKEITFFILSSLILTFILQIRIVFSYWKKSSDRIFVPPSNSQSL